MSKREEFVMSRILINEEEASKITGLKVPTLRKRRWQGLPPRYLKIGSKVYYDQKILEDFLDTCVCTSTTKKREDHEF